MIDKKKIPILTDGHSQSNNLEKSSLSVKPQKEMNQKAN